MTKKARKAIARIMAVLMVFTLLPFQFSVNMAMVEASETSESTGGGYKDDEAFSETDVEEAASAEDASADTENVTVTQSESAEDTLTEDKTDTEQDEEGSVWVRDDDVTEKDDVEQEKDPAETYNKAATEYIHNFTESGKNSNFYTITGNLSTGKGTVTYNGLSLTQCLKLESATNISFTAEGAGVLTLVFVETAATIKVDGTKYTASGNGIISKEISEGNHTITKADSANLFYMVFAMQSKDKVASPVSLNESDVEVKVGDTITLSCDTEGASIFYTTDESDPKDNASREEYTNGITIDFDMINADNNLIIKAYAAKEGYDDSDTATFTYTVSTALGENQLERPTAEPDSAKVPRGTEVILKSADANASIYYTLDETVPNKDNGILFDEAAPIVINEATTIKAIATADGKDDSFPATFTYTIKQPKIVVEKDSASIISSVEPEGDISFINQDSKEVFDIQLKAETNASPSNDIKTKAEELKEDGGEILYYDFTLINVEATADTVSLAQDIQGKLKIKMPYSLVSKMSKRNEIAVLHNTDVVEVTKEADGFYFYADSFSPYTVIVNPAPAVQGIAITESAGYEEGAYAEWEAVDGADGYMAYVAPAGGKYTRIDDELIRKYDNYWRVDTVGLAKGIYYIKIDAVVLGEDNGKATATVIATNATKALKVTNYDRSGFAFSDKSPLKTGSGAYNDDGTLKDGAQVIYVTKDTAKTCKAMIHINGESKPAEEVTGLQTILDAKQKRGTSNDILDIRIIGCVNLEDLDKISSSAEGIQIKGNAARTPMNITLEGIGEDAVAKGFGFLIRNCGNVEFRNFGILDFMDDGVSIDTDNCNLWIHDLDLFYGQAGGAADQKKGDGTIDIKLSQYCTVSYNHFWDSGKSCLIDASPKTDNYADYLTYHHNWFDHSDSRHPRIRNGHNFHIYNNYYDGNSKYGVGSTTGSSAFVEANYFENCNYPMMISMQGTDALGTGTFSKENGGMIKAYANHIEGEKSYLPYSSTNKTEFDAYEVNDASEQVPESVTAKAGASSYNNFDTSADMYFYVADTAADAKENVKKYAGRLNGGDLRWTFDASENTNYAVIPALKEAVVNYKTSVKTIGGGVEGNPAVIDGDDSMAGPGDDLTSVSAPKANKPTNTQVEKGTKITLSCDTAGAQIYYTLNGGVPTQSSIHYTGAIEIKGTITIRAIAILGNAVSDVSIFKYTVPGEPGEGDNSGGDDNPGGDDQPANTKIVTYEFNPQGANMSADTIMPAEDTKYGTDNYFVIGNTNEKGKIAKANTNAPIPSKSSVTGKYTVRYQFGGTAATANDPRAIRFTTSNKARVSVAAFRTGTDERNIYLDTDGNVKVLSASVAEYMFDIIEAGTHGIYAKDGDIAILYVIVEEFVPITENPGDNTEVKAPYSTVSQGEVLKGTKVELKCDTPNAVIYYTTDGTAPTTASTRYTQPIVIDKDITIKAIASLNGVTSQSVTFQYKVKQDDDKVRIPEPNYPSGEKLRKGTEITLTSDEGAVIYYTLDGKEPTKQSMLYTEPIVIETATIIKAFAVKEGLSDSAVITLEYTVFENADVEQAAEPKADIKSGTVKKGTKITLTSDTPGAQIYYTLDDTAPTEDSTLYTEPIEINISTTIKAFAVKQDYMSSTIATFEYSVIEDGSQEPSIPEGVGLRIAFKNANETYTYTGSAIKPDIVVWNNSDKLVEGTDYTVKYTNNINASVDAKENKKPKITVTGKGNLTGTATTIFEIQKKQLEDTKRGADPVVIGGVTDNGELIVVEKSTASPVLYYGGVKLSNKDYSISDAKKKYALGDIGKIIITGKGNFAGTLTYDLKVIRKNELKKFTVSFAAPNYTYNGEPQKIELKDSDVKDADGNILKEGQNYTVVYQNDLTNAGTVKLTVVGLGYYTGSVAKSYTIKPNAVTSGMEITGVSSEPYPYTGLGVTIPAIGVSYQGIPLEEGRDYKLAYGSNKKVGTAKCTVSFMGNYKGSKAVSKNFTIGANSLTDETEGVKIVIPNMVFNRPGVYKSKPYVSVNGVEVKASEYTVKYYTDKDRIAEMGKIMEADTEVYVKIEGKDKSNYKGMLLTASYKVQKKPETAIDLSKAKVTVYTDWSDSATKTNKFEYTGKEIEPSVMIEIKQGNVTLSPKNVKQLMDEEKLTITYTNNIHKGKAAMIINGDGETYVGSKTATFSITTKNIKDTKILDDLFEKIAAMCSVRYLVEAP